MEKYLKDRQYYIDLYDRGTVEQCRRWVKGFSKPIKDKANKVEEIKYEWSLVTRDISFYFIKGDRYDRKSETIEKWMAKDKHRDEIFENAQPLAGVRCLSCNSLMEVKDKDLRSSLEDDDKVMFLYSCPNCQRARFFFAGGKEHIPEKIKDDGNIDLTYSKPIKEENTVDHNYAKDRDRFCMTDEEGKEYLSAKFKMDQLEFIKKESQKEKEIIEKTKHIKKLNITELEELLSKELAKINFVKFETSNPEMGTDIVISFTIHDSQKDRSNYDSQNQLKKAIGSILKNTNWHLMSDGVSYRLGILSGRLRGLDS